MATITKADIARMLAEELGLKNSFALKVVDSVVAGLTDAIIQGNRIEIRGFGVWKVKETNAKHNARNPMTGDTVHVPARRKVMFRPGKEVKAAMCLPAGHPDS